MKWQSPDVMIESDASLTGWGATSNDVNTGGPWNTQERHWHINCLEIQAASLAVRTYLKNQPNKRVLLLLDNTTAVSYINHLGGYSIPPGDTFSEGSMVMVPETEYLIEGTTSPRKGECYSGQRVQSNEGQIRLDVEPSSVQQGTVSTGNGDRPVCISSDLPATTVLQLETGPTSNSDRCIPTGLVEHESVRQPPLESNRQSPSKDSGTSQYPDDPNNTIMDVPAMVPSIAGPSDGHATPPSRDGGSNPTNVGGNITRGNSQASRVAYLKQSYSTQNISESASRLLLASWREKSSKSYDSLFRKWVSWCEERNTNPITSPVNEVVNFLANLHEQGYSYRSLNAYRSAISSTHDRVDGVAIGQHPLVCRLLTGVFNSNPPQPRYTSTWDVNVVIEYLKTLPSNPTLPLKLLTMKTVMLFALTKSSRSSDLCLLSVEHYQLTPEGICFFPTGLTKQSRAGRITNEIFFHRFPEDESICPVSTAMHYIRRTESLRLTESKHKQSKMFISWIKPHHSVTSASIARWLKTVLEQAGINTSIFKAHSTRGASVSAAKNMGVTTKEILDTANWSTESVFQKYYYKPIRNSDFSDAILTSQKQTTGH